MSRAFRVLESPQAVASAFAEFFQDWISNFEIDRQINIALSGGSTPKLLFQLWARDYCDPIDWNRIHFFWGDERCVPPDDQESNFGMANELFLKPCKVPEASIHRIRGENDPSEEAQRYSDEILEYVTARNANELPVFDLIILGMGADGHTASIFPHELDLMSAASVCAVATHPESGQQRVTLTGPVINCAEKVIALVTGESKSAVVAEIFSGDSSYPMSAVDPPGGIEFYFDEAAGKEIASAR